MNSTPYQAYIDADGVLVYTKTIVKKMKADIVEWMELYEARNLAKAVSFVHSDETSAKVGRITLTRGANDNIVVSKWPEESVTMPSETFISYITNTPAKVPWYLREKESDDRCEIAGMGGCYPGCPHNK